MLLILAFYFFYNSLFGLLVNKKNILIVSIVSTTAHIVNMRNLYEGLYWTSSAFVYQLAIIIFLLGIAAIIKTIRKYSIGSTLFSLFCSIVLPGTSELLVPAYLIGLISLVVIVYRLQMKTKVLIANIIATIIGTVIVLLSPGNYSRVQNDALNYSQSLMFALKRSFESVGYYTFIWIFNPVNILILLLALPFLLKLSSKVDGFLQLLKPFNKGILFIAASILICMSIYIPLFYFEADTPFPRITTMVFIIEFFLFLIFLCNLLKISVLNQKISKIVELKNYKKICWLLFFIALFCNKNFLAVTKDLLTGTAYRFNKEYTAKYREIRNCKNDTCYITPFRNWPESIQLGKQDTSSGSVLHMEKYFGKVIIIKHSSE